MTAVIARYILFEVRFNFHAFNIQLQCQMSAYLTTYDYMYYYYRRPAPRGPLRQPRRCQLLVVPRQR